MNFGEIISGGAPRQNNGCKKSSRLSLEVAFRDLPKTKPYFKLLNV